MTILRQLKAQIVGGSEQRETRRAVLALALPLVGSDLLQRGVNVVDALLDGRLGPAELAAVGLSQLLLMFVMALVYGLGVGATVMVAFHTGATDNRRRALAARTDPPDRGGRHAHSRLHRNSVLVGGRTFTSNAGAYSTTDISPPIL